MSNPAGANAQPFPLWDFSGYNSLTTEEVPPLGDIDTQMKWYWETSHYKKELGDLVLDRVFNHHGPSRTVPDDFGVLLTSSNIENHLANIREGQRLYRASHPQDIAEIERMSVNLGPK